MEKLRDGSYWGDERVRFMLCLVDFKEGVTGLVCVLNKFLAVKK